MSYSDSRCPDHMVESSPYLDCDLCVGVMLERERILKAVVELEHTSHSTRTPIYQDTFFKYIKDVIYEQHPPVHFRDTANGE